MRARWEFRYFLPSTKRSAGPGDEGVAWRPGFKESIPNLTFRPYDPIPIRVAAMDAKDTCSIGFLLKRNPFCLVVGIGLYSQCNIVVVPNTQMQQMTLL